jgi:hypothetical protein
VSGDPPASRRVATGVLLVAPALLAPLAVLLARAIPTPILLPLLATAAVYPFMATLLLRRQRPAACTAALLWAATLSAGVITAARRDGVSMERVILNGGAYRDEMFAFVRTGVGREGDPARFLPQHVLHLATFALLSASSGGLLGIALGAVLVGYMSYYVGSLAAAGGAPWTAILLGWPPYAILRVTAFIVAGVCLAEPLLFAAARRLTRSPLPMPAPRGRWYLAAFLLLAGDVVLKIFLAPIWSILLRPCLSP